MSELFDNYPQGSSYIPNNRPQCVETEETKILIGSTVEHTFDVPYNVAVDLDELEVIYKLGVDVVLTKKLSEEELTYVIKGEHRSFVMSRISPEESLLFNNDLLDCFVQLKFTFLDDSINYSNLTPIKILKTLDN